MLAKVLCIGLLVLVASHVQAASVQCVDKLSDSTEQFVKQIESQDLLFGFQDGDIHLLRIERNELGISTARYGRMGGETIYDHMVLRECRAPNEGGRYRYKVYLEAFKDLHSPSGTYKYPARLLIPVGLPPKALGYADLRWGYFNSVILVLRKK